ncbi:MAG: helix-turn-helix transcriptional regulator [Roseburia sp.]|jgi:DNA-binding XRE family transcriptional regulator|nr:helix-turn-helix transcriptional regulator [Roseburia sp.]
MKMGKTDYILNEGNENILIEVQRQQDVTREEVITLFRNYRKELGMTQSQLGQKAGVTQPNITRFESGNYNPSLEFMVRIAVAMGKKVKVVLED